MEKFIKQCVIGALLALALVLLGDIPPESWSLTATAIRLIVLKALGLLVFGFTVRIDKQWRVYGRVD